VPVVALMAFLIGVVLAFQGLAQLRQFGAEEDVGQNGRLRTQILPQRLRAKLEGTRGTGQHPSTGIDELMPWNFDKLA
jgi:hypothetical protein